MSKDPFADIVNAPDDQYGAFADIVHSDDHHTIIPAKDNSGDGMPRQPFASMQEQIDASKQRAIDEGLTYKNADKRTLPNVWNAVVNGAQVTAALDRQAGGYIYNDLNGRPHILIRMTDGSLGSRPYQYPGTNPTESMSAGQRMAAGAGKSIVDVGRGLQQLTATGERAQQLAAENADRAAIDRPLMETGAGKAGYLGGAVATMLTPGVVLRGAGMAAQAANAPRVAQALDTAGQAITAPKSYWGAAGLGAAQGAVQPASSTTERAINTGLGGVVGAVVPAAVRGAGAAVERYAPSVADVGRAVAATAKTLPGAVAESAGLPRVAAALNPAPAIATPVVQVAAQQPVKISMQDAAKEAEKATKAIGFNWQGLDEATRLKMAAQVHDAINLDAGLPPESVAKKVMLESMGFKPTRAMVTGNPEDFRIENSARLYPEGADLVTTDTLNNANLRAQIQKAAPVAPEPVSEFGQTLRKELGKEAAVSEGRVGSLYKAAAKNEGYITTDATPLIKALADKNAFAVTKTDSPVMQYLKTIGKDRVFFPTANTVTAKNQPKELTMEELATLRQIVNSKWENIDNATQTSLDRLRSVLNKMEANPNEPAPLYQKARVSRIIQGKKWESPELNDLFAQDPTYKGRMQIADEELFNHVFLRPTTDKTASVWARMNSAQKDAARAQLAQHIENQAFGGQSLTPGIDREVAATPSKFIRTLDKIGPNKLRLILGQKEAQRLRDLATAWRDISTSPANTKAAGSAPELANIFRNITSTISSLKNNLPYVGKPLAVIDKLTGKEERQKAADAAAKLAEESATRKAQVQSALSPIESAREARKTALAETVKKAENEKKRRGALTIPAVAGQSALSR